jgi:uncharacterized secreted repeat protein (TIGR03808 family)
MTPDRRAVLGLFSAGMILPAQIVLAQADTQRIEREIVDATSRGKPYILPPGQLLTGSLRLPDGAHLMGTRGRSRLALVGDGPLLRAEGVRRITLEGVTLDGGRRQMGENTAMLQFREISDFTMQDCTVERGGSNGLNLDRCGGRISGNRFHDHARAALFAIDNRGLTIENNTVERCGDNGILVWRSAKGDDGTIIRGNRISDIKANAGGSGQYGNAIGLYRAGGVVVQGNVIRRAAYTAVRNNGGSNVIVQGNSVAQCGEVALYSEFGFDGTSVTGNIVDGAWAGIIITNFADHGGRMGAITGNVVRNIRKGRHPSNSELGGGHGIFVEGDATIAGNIVDGGESTGLSLGWGPSLRDVTATGNTLRDCGDGIQISVAPGAGSASIVGNTISGSRRHAVVGMQWLKTTTGDLAVTGTKDWPNIRLAENVIR